MDKKTRNILIGGAVAAAGAAIYVITKKRKEKENQKELDQSNGSTMPITFPPPTPDDPTDGLGGGTTPVIYGCTDPDANNYDASATNSDNSCTYNQGCTDENALNYDSGAFLDDGSCEFSVHLIFKRQYMDVWMS